ncbi:AmiS/UreI family transporter [Nitrosomonas eutropha]|uniref:AmiS/UreI family transporter n=1 Tax=Nitrosomonas eutropha TaxID=916 RepID=UPI00088E7675|nr:AmiS/UreI family transporter [Nitrosomonas eutropha]SCX23826.1 AmiS/UreI family transporter [Nitrosomonas eutropha]
MAGDFLGVPLLFIGFILIVNAIWLQGKVDTKDVGIFNLLVGILATIGALYFGLVQNNFPLSAGGLLFAMTYLWVGVNAVRGAEDQRALGYYCLLVAFTTVSYAIKAFMDGDLGWTFEWITYGILWYLFYQIMTKGNTKLMGMTIAMTYFVGIEVAITGWIYLYGYWPFGNWWPLQITAS